MLNLFVILTSITCTYSFSRAPVPMATVEVTFDAQGKPADRAKVTMHGRTHFESLTPVESGAGEMFHAWLSQESAENSIEMIVYQEPQASGRSKLVNNRMPIGKEMWGSCEIKGL